MPGNIIPPDRIPDLMAWRIAPVPGGGDAFVAKLTGLALPLGAHSPATLTFQKQLVGTTSAAQVLTLSNIGDGPLSISSLAVDAHFDESSTCEASVAGNANCPINVIFKPTTAGDLTGSLTIQTDASGSPHTVNLSGTGTDFALGVQSGGATSATVSAGSTATYNLQIEPTVFVGNVSLGCAFQGSTPRGASCSVSPNVVALNGTDPGPFTVNVATTARSLAVPRGPALPPINTPVRHIVILLLLGLALAVLASKNRRVKEQLCAIRAVAALSERRRWFAGHRPALQWAPLVATLFIVLLWAACGGGGGGGTPTPPQVGTPAGNYTLTLTATAGGVSKTTTLTLKVN